MPILFDVERPNLACKLMGKEYFSWEQPAMLPNLRGCSPVPKILGDMATMFDLELSNSALYEFRVVYAPTT